MHTPKPLRSPPHGALGEPIRPNCREMGSRGVGGHATAPFCSPGAMTHCSAASQGTASKPRPLGALSLPKAHRSNRSTSCRDPRPVAEKAFLVKCARKVMEFLIEKNYSGKAIFQPEMLLKHLSTKDFFDIFRFFVLQVDPMVDIPQQHPKEVVPSLMKRFKYPVEVNKSKLQAISGMNIRNQLLAVLDWFVDIVRCLEGFVRPAAELVDRWTDMDQALLDQLQMDYQQYLLGEDSDSNADHLKRMFQERMEAIQAESSRLVGQQEEIAKAVDRYRHEHLELLQLRQAPGQLHREAEQLRNSIQSQERAVSSIELEISGCEEEQQARGQVLEVLEVQMRLLAEQVESQPWSKQDLARFKAERDHLRKLLTDICSEAQREEQLSWEYGIEDSHLIASLERVVQRVAEFGDTLEDGAGAPLPNVCFDASAEELASMDLATARRALQSQALCHQEQAQAQDGQLQETLDRRRAAQEELLEEQRQCALLQGHRDRLQRRHEEFFGWSARQLEDACRTAEATEDGAEAGSFSDSSLLREAAQLDELRLRLAQLRQSSDRKCRQLEELLRWRQEWSQEQRGHIQMELQEASKGADALHRLVMQQLEEPKREELREIKAPWGGC